jgi:hypothetical protein
VLAQAALWRWSEQAAIEGEIHRVEPDFGSTLTVSSMDSQSNCWVNWEIVGQPCEFQVSDLAQLAHRRQAAGARRPLGLAGLRVPARAGNRRFRRLSARRARAKAPYKTDLLWEIRRALNRPGGPGPDRGVGGRGRRLPGGGAVSPCSAIGLIPDRSPAVFIRDETPVPSGIAVGVAAV